MERKKSRGERRRASRGKAGIGPAWDLAERERERALALSYHLPYPNLKADIS